MTGHSLRGSHIRALLRATHLPQALAMVAVMTVATVACRATWLSVVLVFLASAAGQATVGWTNDLHDAAADRDAERMNKPTVRGALRAEDFRIPILVSGSLTIPLSLVASGWIGGGAHIAAVASALAYNFFLARTAWSWVPYAVSFALIPLFVAQASSPALWPSTPVIVLSALVGVIAHIFNALPDIATDRRAGWGGLAVSLGTTRSRIVLAILMALAAVCAGYIGFGYIDMTFAVR